MVKNIVWDGESTWPPKGKKLDPPFKLEPIDIINDTEVVGYEVPIESLSEKEADAEDN